MGCFGRRTSRQGPEYVKDGMLLYLDGRDAPVGGAWVDRVSGRACPVTSSLIAYSAAGRCYMKAAAGTGYITLPNELLLDNDLFTVQVVAKNEEAANGAFVSFHSHMNGQTQFCIWPNLSPAVFSPNPGGTAVSGIIYRTYNNGYCEGFPNPESAGINSFSGSRDGDSTCKSAYNGTIVTQSIATRQRTDSRGNYIFTDGGWMLSKASVYCVRVYDRVLTDEEILYNYEIDKQIFKSL
jgi:hypothetical protein